MLTTFRWRDETLHYVAEGAGPPVILLHGLGGNANNWLNQRRFLSKDHRVLSLDLPGHGRSTGREVAFADYWRVVGALLDHLGIERAALCGLSMGARAALAFAARAPSRVERIVVVNTLVRLEPQDWTPRLALYDLLAQEGGAVPWATQLLALMGVADRPAIVRGFIQSLEAIDPAHIRRIFRELHAYDQLTEFDAIGCPALIVHGDKDGLTPAYCADEIHAGLAGSRIAVMPDCGHLPYLEDAPGFNRLVADFLAPGPSNGS